MMSHPKISLIIPVYNVEKYLERCMNTVLAQTLEEIEVILVDDGSPDNCPQLCDEYETKDKRVRVIHKANGGLGFARNSGLEVATGEYVAFIDSDDYIDLKMYEDLYLHAKSNGMDAVFCGFKIESRSGIWSSSSEVDAFTIFEGKGLTNFMLDMVASAKEEAIERKYYMSVWHAIYRRSIIEKNNIRFLSEREIASEDIPFQVDFLRAASGVAYLPNNYYYYCHNGTSLTATFCSKKFQRFKELRNVLIDKLSGIDNGKERCDRLFIGYSRTQLHQLVESKYPKKLQEIRNIFNDDIWNMLKHDYPINEVKRIDQKIMYFLILHKFALGLYLNSKIINILRRFS